MQPNITGNRKESKQTARQNMAEINAVCSCPARRRCWSCGRL